MCECIFLFERCIVSGYIKKCLAICVCMYACMCGMCMGMYVYVCVCMYV